jgi:subfamily B ATP-binding cassette protein HlyB/CyaB
LKELASSDWLGHLFGRRPASIGCELSLQDIIWTLGSASMLHRRAFDAELIARELPAPPLHVDSLITGARALGFRVKGRISTRAELVPLTLPCVGLLKELTRADASRARPDEPSPAPISPETHPALIVQIDATHAMLFRAGTNQPVTLTHAEFEQEFTGAVYQFAPLGDSLKDPDSARAIQRAFGIRWIIPELLKRKLVWRDVLIAYLFIQLLALGTPLFTQVVIDKVVVHRAQSTLAVIAIGMGVFGIFSSLLSWVRQYLVPIQAIGSMLYSDRPLSSIF